MKGFLSALIICLLIIPIQHSAAQGFLDKMKKFAGSSDSLGVWKKGWSYVIDGPGTITLADGSKQDGTIVFNITGENEDLQYIYFTPASAMKPVQMWSDDFASFTVKGKTFVPVRMKEDDMTVGHKTIFMEMLNGSMTDKFKMYRFRKLEKKDAQFATTDRPAELKRGYYVMLPDFKNAHEIVDVTFTPFASKMSDYLKDCPALAEKISNKEKGYKYNMFKGAENEEIFIRVMEEYNSCGK